MRTELEVYAYDDEGVRLTQHGAVQLLSWTQAENLHAGLSKALEERKQDEVQER